MKGGWYDPSSRSLPVRLSIFRKPAKKLARNIAAGDAGRHCTCTCVPAKSGDLPLTQRNAQLVIAREYRLRRLATSHR